jgi:signal transduction histidine kinase
MRARLTEHMRQRVAIMAAIAHDLRTPLTGLRLRVEGLEGEARGFASADIGRMERMIQQMLAYVRGEEETWLEAPVDLVDVAEQCVAEHLALGNDVVLDAQGEQAVVADHDQLSRALANLLDNAVLHGGRAAVAIRRDGADVVCTIDDDGPGLPDDQLEAVFAPFHRADASRGRERGGTGLGLAIARRIVLRCRGSIGLANLPGGELSAWFRIPSAGAHDRYAPDIDRDRR